MGKDRTVTAPGFRLIIRNGSLSTELRKAAMVGLAKVAKNYEKEIKKVISLDDHTLEELRKLGHPYAVGATPDFHGDDRLVHQQTGELLRSIKVEDPIEESSRTLYVAITSNSPYMPFLIHGTSTMRPRDFPALAYENIKDKYWEPLLDALRVNFRTQQGER